MTETAPATGAGRIRVIGRCAVASCRRPAAHHLVLSVGAAIVAGAVCDNCQRATRLASFLLDLPAA